MFKLVNNNKIVDVIRYPNYVRFQKFGKVAITDKSSAQGIVGSDGYTLYSLYYIPELDYEIVSLHEIDLNEFNRLKVLLDNNQIISTDEALEEAREIKIRSLSIACKNKITKGFSILLSDGEKHHFKLTVEDQLNLMSLENQLKSEQNSFIYHSTNNLCRMFSRADVEKIVKTFRLFTVYHTTYFNTAKHYIKSLTDIEKIKSFSYGLDVSDFVTDVTIKQILREGAFFDESKG